MPDRPNSDTREDFLEKDALKDSAVMNDSGTRYGIPNTVYFVGIAMTLIFGALLRWWTGAAFAFIWFYSMYEIHKDDPRALESWVKAAIGRKIDIRTAGEHKRRKIYFLDNRE